MNFISKTQEKIKSLTRDQLAFILLAGLVLLAFMLYFFWPENKQDRVDDIIDQGGVEQGLNTTENRRIGIDRTVAERGGPLPKSLSVYEYEQINSLGIINEFIRKSGRGFISRENYSDLLYVWSAKPGEPTNVVEYNVTHSTLGFNFDDPATLSDVPLVDFDSRNPNKYFSDVVFSATGQRWEFDNLDVTQVGREYFIRANRMIDGYPVELPGSFDYSDELQVTSDGRLIYGKLLMISIDEDSAVKLPLLEPLQLATVISRDDYPKDFNQLAPIGLAPEDYGVVPYEIDTESGFLGDAPIGAKEIPDVTSCEAFSIRLVYYYVSSRNDMLTPVYRVDCRGKINFLDNVYDVPIIIYTNALDPQYVSVTVR